ncbi:hypothetical protein RB653_007541 [Dictyostelium firmibasis]|uniref:STAS domain-containing protein n=1 Tax=Dictyostelium firmibasis TaxID=79012 RepID=A0AAN7TVS6_9MYCE
MTKKLDNENGNLENTPLSGPLGSPYNQYGDDGSSTSSDYSGMRRSTYLSGSTGVEMEQIEISSSKENLVLDVLKNSGFNKETDMELNQRIKKRFEDSLSYFDNLLNTITNTKSSPKSPNVSLTPNNNINNNNNNNNLNSPNNILFVPNELKNSKKERSNENLLEVYENNNSNNNNNNTEDNFLGGSEINNINIPFNLGGSNSGLRSTINSNRAISPDQDDIIEDNLFSESSDKDTDDFSTKDGDGQLKSISKMKRELKEYFLSLSYKKREEISFSLSVEQDPLIIDQTIDQYFDSFINDCYNEIINKFKNQYPTIVETIKMIRISPDRRGDARKAVDPTQYVPIHKSYTPGSYQFSLKELIITKVVNEINKQMIKTFLLSMLPITKWVPNYKLKYIKDDVISSITVGLMLVPQSMAYAILGGLPAIYGLYSAFIGPIVYGIFGTSNEISVGPVAMVSLLIPNVIGLPSTNPEYLTEAICLSLLSGLILMTIGFLRAGFLIENLLSNPILMGFIQAASLLIICSQIKGLTSIPVPSTVSTFPEFVKSYAEHYGSIHGWTVLFGLVALVILLVFRKLNQKLKYKVPIAVVILILSTLISYLIDSKSHGIKIIDSIPSGLPTPKAVSLTAERFGKLIVGAFIISILGFVESISIAKKFSSIRKYTIDPSQELISLGMVNLIGSFLQAMPATGSFSRTAVNFQTNSRSRVCSIASGIIVACVLLFLTPIIKHTPLCILSAIVIAAAVSLFEFKESYELFKHGEILGFIQLIFVFIITLMLGSEIGIVVAFCVSILQIIYFSARPQLVTLGRLPGTLVFRNINHYAGAITNKRVKILRYDARLTYYTVNHFRDCLYGVISNDNNNNNNSNNTNGASDISPSDNANQSGAIHTVIIDMVNVSSIDSTAIDVLNEIVDFFKSQDVIILWSDIRPAIQKVMHRSGFLKKIDHQHFFNSTDKALEFALSN